MIPHGDRGAEMARSLARAVRGQGVPDAGVARVEEAHGLAMEPRVRALRDDHHPAYLHPGRSALILLRDASVTAVPVLAAACLVETRDPELRVAPERIGSAVGPDVEELVAAAPPPGAEGLAEALVVAPEEVRLVALAEHLDHLRHLHVRGPEPDWPERLDEVEAVWLPVAERTHARLATRYRHWARIFRRRVG